MKPTFQAMILWQAVILCHQLCVSLCAAESNENMLDMSYELSAGSVSFSGIPVTMNVSRNGTMDRGDGEYWYQNEAVSFGTHTGTHLDSPCHFHLERWCVSDIPVSRLVAPVAMVDIRNYVKNDPYAFLTVEHLQEWEKSHGQIPDGSVLMVNTGWSRFWTNRMDYTGTPEFNFRDMKFPYISTDAAQWLVDNRNIVGVGIDTLSVEKAGGYRTHVTLANRNIYNLENLNGNIDKVPPTGAIVYAMPIKLKDASGVPCRVLVSVKGNELRNDSCRYYTCSILMGFMILVCFYVFSSKGY